MGQRYRRAAGIRQDGRASRLLGSGRLPWRALSLRSCRSGRSRSPPRMLAREAGPQPVLLRTPPASRGLSCPACHLLVPKALKTQRRSDAVCRGSSLSPARIEGNSYAFMREGRPASAVLDVFQARIVTSETILPFFQARGKICDDHFSAAWCSSSRRRTLIAPSSMLFCRRI